MYKITFLIWFSKPDPSAVLSVNSNSYFVLAQGQKPYSHPWLLSFIQSDRKSYWFCLKNKKINKNKSDHFIPLLYHPKPIYRQLSLGLLHSFFIVSLFPLLHLVVVVQSLSHVQLFATPWTAARQASLSFIISWSLLKLLSIESVMPFTHLVLCHPLLLLPSIF